jgi:uncharacterized protein
MRVQSVPVTTLITSPAPEAIGPLELLVLQATPFCNLDCSYCYLPNRNDNSKMDVAVIEKAIERVLEAELAKDEFTAVWHAGEPLVLGVDYYEQAIERIASIVPSDITVHHSFQTNGVLIDSEWCDFFNRHHVRLGLSIDGPEEMHDRYRKTRNGRGTHHKVTRAVNQLNEANTSYHVISVLTDEAIQQADTLFHYFNELGSAFLCFNIEEIEGCNRNSTVLERDRYSVYREFLARFHHLRQEHQSIFKVREIDGVLSAVMNWQSGHQAEHFRHQENTPFKILSIDVNGNFSTFSPELLGTSNSQYGDLSLANLFNTSIAECLQSPHYQRIATAVSDGVRQCKLECDYFELCGGGSPSNKLAENQRFDSSETEFCRLQKKACVDFGLSELEQMLGIEAGIN